MRSFLLVTLTVCACRVCPPTPASTPLSGPIAELVQPQLVLEPGRVARTYWVNAPTAMELAITWPSTVGVAFHVLGGPSLPATPVKDAITTQLPAGVTVLVDIWRRDATTDRIALDAGLLVKGELGRRTDRPLHSPVIRTSDGSPLETAPDGSDLVAFTRAGYGYDPREGMGFLAYAAASELFAAICPAGANGPRPPVGAKHDDNYCGMSMFVHSMEAHFPGALQPDVRTSKDSWDKVGDSLDHSNTTGERLGKLISNVNDNYGTTPPATRNGKRYCAAEIEAAKLQNLKNFTEDCNVGLLLYDYPEFGHWADVDSVDPTTGKITLQDYEQKYDVKFDEANKNVDFTGAPKSTMTSEFDADNPVCGDAIDEDVYFVAICECDPSSAKPKMPTTTKSGKPLTYE